MLYAEKHIHHYYEMKKQRNKIMVMAGNEELPARRG